MTVISTLSRYPGATTPGTVRVVVNPTPTEVERWTATSFESGRVALENLDASQTYNGHLEVRPVAGVGNWGVVGETSWSTILAGELRDFALPDWVVGAGELRFVLSTSGAGGFANYTRRAVHLANT